MNDYKKYSINQGEKNIMKNYSNLYYKAEIGSNQRVQIIKEAKKHLIKFSHHWSHHSIRLYFNNNKHKYLQNLNILNDDIENQKAIREFQLFSSFRILNHYKLSSNKITLKTITYRTNYCYKVKLKINIETREEIISGDHLLSCKKRIFFNENESLYFLAKCMEFAKK